jgi:flagellar basal-body rod protein FlgB
LSNFGIFDKTALTALRSMMDFSALRQRAYSANVANASTPGYQRQDVKFADELRKSSANKLSIRATHPGHIGSARPKSEAPAITRDSAEPSVDLEKETVALAQNQLRFSAAAKLAALRIQSLRSCIRGG